MASQKSSAAPASIAQAILPKRARGRLRVAAILDAGAAVIAEKGHAAATMSEIAARSSTAIGSLYRFFPTKDALTDALLERFVGEIESTLTDIARRAPELGPPAVADALIDMMLDLKAYRAAALELLDVKGDAEARRQSVRGTMRRGVGSVLRALNPQLDAGKAAIVANVVVQMMKIVRALSEQGNRDVKKSIDELRVALSLYIAERTSGV